MLVLEHCALGAEAEKVGQEMPGREILKAPASQQPWLGAKTDINANWNNALLGVTEKVFESFSMLRSPVWSLLILINLEPRIGKGISGLAAAAAGLEGPSPKTE